MGDHSWKTDFFPTALGRHNVSDQWNMKLVNTGWIVFRDGTIPPALPAVRRLKITANKLTLDQNLVVDQRGKWKRDCS